MKQVIATAVFLMMIGFSYGQTAKLKGRVTDAVTNQAIPYANVFIQNTSTGTTTDTAGNFMFDNLNPGFYNIQISFTGYVTKSIFEVEVNNAKMAILDVPLETEVKEINQVVVTGSKTFIKTQESPVSVRSLGLNEIQRYPGGNRDISKVIQSLPGVAPTNTNRNDIIIRGGSPSENKFYVDGIEVPTINHFSTQGASGGPVGLINVDLIKDVDFYSSAFPANRNTGLSSNMELKLRDGRDDKHGFNFTIGASEAALSVEGPINKKKTATYIISARQSYLQFLFQALKLPFLPTFNDFQLKVKRRIGTKHEIEFLGLGTYDRSKLNLKANETESQRYLLNVIPEQKQIFYTMGLKYRYFTENGSWTFVLSRNMLINLSTKYKDNDKNGFKTLDYSSQEAENKFRVENVKRINGFKITSGFSYEYDKYNNKSTFGFTTPAGQFVADIKSDIDFHRYGVFVQASRSFADNKLDLSLGLRMDGNSYNKDMLQLYKQTSPRFSLAYKFAKNFALNFNTGHYYQSPQYTTMGFRDNSGVLVNKAALKYISCTHVVLGLEYNTTFNSKVSVEGFYKNYNNYPFLTNDSISLANLGGSFGVVGNEPAVSNGQGRAYGAEFLYQQKLFKGFFGSISYTIFVSEFKNKYGKYAPSAWDNRHIISATFGKKFKHNYEIGTVFKLAGGTPYTPIDSAYSSFKPVWDINRSGVVDYDLVNTQRLGLFYQLDIRVSKKWNFKKWNLELYLDIQNLTNFKQKAAPGLAAVTDNNFMPLTSTVNPMYYQTKSVKNTNGTLLPSIGFIIGL